MSGSGIWRNLGFGGSGIWRNLGFGGFWDSEIWRNLGFGGIWDLAESGIWRILGFGGSGIWDLGFGGIWRKCRFGRFGWQELAGWLDLAEGRQNRVLAPPGVDKTAINRVFSGFSGIRTLDLVPKWHFGTIFGAKVPPVDQILGNLVSDLRFGRIPGFGRSDPGFGRIPGFGRSGGSGGFQDLAGIQDLGFGGLADLGNPGNPRIWEIREFRKSAVF